MNQTGNRATSATPGFGASSPHRSRAPLKKSLLALAVAAAAVSAQAQQSVIEEVTVTAQKREQNMQDVSVAVSAFSGDAIDRMGFEEGLDITQQVPNMSFFAIFGEASSPSVSLRGISLVNFSDSWESPVSIYVDDVYRGNPAGSAIQLFDLERVEVLRGPQGTIYGRNTTGGLVHYVSRKPTETFEAKFSASVGNYGETIAQGAVSGPLVDGVRGRLAVKRTKNDGWQTNPVDGRKLNETDSLGYRGQLEFDVGRTGMFLLNVHGSEADQASVGFSHMGYLDPDDLSQTCSVKRIQNGECSSNTFGFTGAEAVNGQYDPEHVATGASEGLNTTIDTFGVSGRYTMDLSDDITLTSVTAYEELDKFLQDDGDGTEVVWFDEQYAVDAEQYTQELRLNGSGLDSNWVTGLYLYKDDRGLITQTPTTADAGVFGGYFHEEYVSLKSESWALFGQYEYDLTPQLTGIFGARYTEEERDFSQRSPVSFYTPRVEGTGDLSESALTGRIGLDWRPREGTLVYANISTGFKSGGFSGSYNASEAALAPVNSEDAINYEVGLKTAWADGRFRLNASAYRYDIEDYQAQVFLTVETGSVITNAGDVTGVGAELEFTARVTDNFELIAGLGLLDTEFSSSQVFNVAGDTYTLDGNELPSAPSTNTNLVARYYIGLGDAGELALQADYTWQADHFLQIENDPYSKQDAYGLGNAKVSWQSMTGDYVVEAFVRNLADKEYYTYQNTLGSDWGYGVWGMPRTYGAKFSWNM